MKKVQLTNQYFLRYTYGKQIYFGKPTKNESNNQLKMKEKKTTTKE